MANPYMQTQPFQGMPQNPYLPDIGNALTAASNQNVRQNLLPTLGRNAIATGGYGGSRQGVAEGTAIGNAQTGLDSALAQMYGSAYNSDQQQATQRYGIDTGAATARYGTDSSSQIANRGIDLNANQQGFNQYLSALNAQLGLGQGISAVGQEQMTASQAPLQTFSNLVNPYTGLNNSNSTTGPDSGGGLAGAAGGALSVANLIALLSGQTPKG